MDHGLLLSLFEYGFDLLVHSGQNCYSHRIDNERKVACCNDDAPKPT